MNPLRTFGCLSMLFAVCLAYSSNSLSNSLKPSEWLSLSELEQLPAVNEVTLEQLERMSLQEGAVLANKIYHLSQVNQEFMPSYVPKVNEIQAYILTPNNEKISFPLSQLAEVAKQQPNFGNDEVTIFITGLSQETETVKKANRILIDAYMQRYNNMQSPKGPITVYPAGQQMRGDSSEEQYYKSGSQKRNTGNLIVIDLGAKIDSFEHCATLDVEKTGAAIAKLLVKLTNEADVPQEIIHIVAQGIAAHVAGSAAREYRRLTGHQLRRITALDPSKIFAKQPNTLIGLARGDADFVDAIHTSAYGMGTVGRVGDVDFYPNGPAAGVPGADNILEASMRATRYFAETVRPGNERNFPAVAASSLQDYRQQNGYGRRAYMGISTNFDLEGDYIMTVNPRSPFGKNAPAQKQTPYHNVHQAWNTSA